MAVIRKTESGKWELDIYIQRKRKRLTFESRREAEDAKRAVLLGEFAPSAEPGKGKAPETKTLKDAIRFYHETISARKGSAKQEKRYFDRIYKFLRAMGVMMVSEVTTMHLDAFKAQRLKDVKGATVNREFGTYLHFFEKCVAWKWHTENPCKLIEHAPEMKNPRRVWTDDEFKTIVKRTPPWISDVLTAMYFFGAGPGELSRLTWSDVNFERSEVTFRRFKGNGDERVRVMAMQPMARAFFFAKFESARRSFLAKPDCHVFLNSRKNKFCPRGVSRSVGRIVKEVGLPPGTVPYGIRHKFATELLEANIGEDQVRRLMGHTSVKTLIENYSHIRQENLNKAMAVRDEQAAGVFPMEKKQQ